MAVKTYFNTKTFDKLLASADLEVTNHPQDAELLVLGAKREDFARFAGLKAVYRFGVGSDNIDFDYLRNKSIPLYFPGEKARKILYEATANFSVYAALSLLYEGALGEIEKWEKKQRVYLGNKSALVIGTGNIGKRVAHKLSVFMKVSTYDSLANKPEELKPLIEAADIITLHLPLNKETQSFFDSEKLSWVKDGCLFINTARGGLFDEDALFDKLNKSACRAFFDVFWQEPYAGRLKYLGGKKFFMSPHSAGNTADFVAAAFEEILNIAKGLK